MRFDAFVLLVACSLPASMSRVPWAELEQTPRELVEAFLAEDGGEEVYGEMLAQPEPVIEAVEDLLEEAPSSELRRFGLRLLGDVGGEAHVQLLLSLAHDPLLEETPSEIRGAFERSFLRMLARDGEAVARLEALLTRAPDDLIESIIARTGVLNSERVLAALCHALGVRPVADARLLSEIERLGRVVPHPIGASLEPLRSYAASSEPLTAMLAVRCLGSVGELDAIPLLIDELGRGGGVRENPLAGHALSALRELTGQDFKTRAGVWRAWYERESLWWTEEAPAHLRDLAAPDAEVAAAAVHALAGHRLFRHELADELAVVLERGEPELVRAACSQLASLRSRNAVPALIRTLESEDPSVRGDALSALRRITGRRLDADPALWRVFEDDHR